MGGENQAFDDMDVIPTQSSVKAQKTAAGESARGQEGKKWEMKDFFSGRQGKRW